MVNTIIVSRYSENFPTGNSEKDRKIANGPLYPASDVLELLASRSTHIITTWTKKCINDVQKWNLDANDLSNLLELAFTARGRFCGSEWCTQKPDGPWAACDAYSVRHEEWITAINKYIEVEYYIKFAIGKTGKILLLASCHNTT